MTKGVREQKLSFLGWALPAVVLVLVLAVFFLYIGRGTRVGPTHAVEAEPPAAYAAAIQSTATAVGTTGG